MGAIGRMNRNQPRQPNLGFGQWVQLDEQEFTRKLKSKATQGVQGYSIATIADYEPNPDLAAKVAVGIVQKLHHPNPFDGNFEPEFDRLAQ
ncbi:hypothetical protein LBWT_X1060 (plasmid) [Leptolyngbya boryana IAM M-101]|nr:hypothetical protein LBWT_X1060 [Leptolyngbya boryana IAM M-101]BAS66382.1 hypothetical protein LBDG_X1060 [Leptolyngbya boryana dg5]